MMVCARHTPVSILWHALGHQRAGLLPGKFGNLLLSATGHRALVAWTAPSFTRARPRISFWISLVPS